MDLGAGLYMYDVVVKGSRSLSHLLMSSCLYLGDSCTDPLLLLRAKFDVIEQTQGLHLQAKFHLNVFIVSASGGQKPQFWANFDIFLGLLYRPPFSDESQMWCAIADPRYTLACQISSRSVYSVALCWRKTPIFGIFWTSAFSVVAN